MKRISVEIGQQVHLFCLLLYLTS